MGYQRTAQSKTAVTDTSKKSVTSPPPVWASPSQSHPLLQLQQKIGNRAVSQLIQAKLKVGKPNDTYEQEADRVADTVMRLSEPTIQRQEEEKEETAQAKSAVGQIQRQEEEKKEETAQTKPIAPITSLIQRQATEEKKEETAQAKGVADTPEVSPHLETRIQTMRGSGQPLPEATRTFFESRFGYDLGGVRVHTDSQADEASRSLNAQAFTIGQNVFFAGGRYEPQTNQGKWLLAHELTHTLQQQPPNPLAARKSTANTQQSKIIPRVSHSPTPLISQKAAATQDSGLKAVVERAKGVAKQKKQHAPAKTKAAQAQAAAKSPPNEVASKASANQVQQMDASQPKPFNRNAFKAALLAKIAATTPKNLKEADEFKESGKVSSIKGELTSEVDTGKKQSQGAVEAKVKAPPDTSGIPSRTATPLPPAETAAPPGNIGAAQAAPKPKSAADVSLQEGSQSLNQKLGEADVTEDQLKKSNEPEFQAAAEAKKQAQKDAVTAPQTYRQSEQAIVTQAQVEATATAQTQLQGMQGVRGQMLNRVQGSQQQTQSKDEQERAKVATEIQATYNRTKQKAEERLTRLDTEVNQAFDEGATAAQQAFEDYVERRMNAYKDERYSGVIGAGRWLKDKFLGMPEEVNVFYTEGKNLYLKKMDAVLDRIAGIVETGLNEAKAEIAKGRKEVQDYVNKQPVNLKQAAQEAGQNIQSQFDQLEQSVNDKQNQLIDSLAQKYNENLQKLDSRIEEMKAKNRGLVDAALDAIGGVIKTILELKNMLLGVLARVAEVVGHIIKHPIDFLGNLVAGVKQGFMNFVGNIGTHLQKGLMGWLFGAMAEAGVQLPESFDLKGILSLVLQVLGLTFAAIRARAVKILGEPIVKALETASEIFQILITQGPGGLWEYIKEKLSDLKDVVIEGIKSFVEESIIKAGITWILGLLNPVGAFIKACKAIYDIVMFFVERGSQILALVNAIIDSMAAIASGAIGVAASAVENALSKAIPVAIAFLAALLGVTGITDKIRSIIAKVQAPVHKAIDWVIDKAYKLVKAAGKLLGFGKGKDKIEDKAKQQERLNQGLNAAQSAVNRFAGKRVGSLVLKPLLGAIRLRYRLASLDVLPEGGHWTIEGSINPSAKIATQAKIPEGQGEAEQVSTASKVKKIRIENGVLKTDDGKQFKVGSEIQVKERKNWLPEQRIIVKISVENIQGTNLIIVRYEKAKGGNAGTILADNYPDKWREPISALQELSDEKLKEENTKEKWYDFETAKKVLNYRVHGKQTINPSGKHWEHIVEQSSIEIHSSENLALTAKEINTELNELYSKTLFWEKYVNETGRRERIILRNYLKGKPISKQREWKLHVYENLKVSLKPKDSNRGKYQVLD